jgi:hypothetical protein
MYTTVKVALAAAALGLVPWARAQTAWKEVGNIGERHFIVVAPADAGNATLIRKAAIAICAPGGPCVVDFWSEAASVPTILPMNPAQREAMVAEYLRNSASGSEALRLRCPPEAATGPKCLR